MALALVTVNLFQPGAGVDPAVASAMLADARGGAGAILSRSTGTPTGIEALLGIIPNNVVAAAANNDILALIFFALLFGIGLLLVNNPRTARLQEVIEGIFEVAMRLIGIVIRLAPIAIAAFMFNLASMFGWDLLIRLGAYVGVILLALALHMGVVYPLALRFLGGVSPLWFFRQSQEALVMAFSTASSNATLPTALRIAEEKLNLVVGVPPEGIGLVLGVDRFLDMCRTALNVAGDLTAAVIISRGEEQDPAPAAAHQTQGSGP